jgi:hypothetical protein
MENKLFLFIYLFYFLSTRSFPCLHEAEIYPLKGLAASGSDDVKLRVGITDFTPQLKMWYFLQCCGSGMFIPDPDFYPSRISEPGSRIPDQKTATKESIEKNFLSYLFM